MIAFPYDSMDELMRIVFINLLPEIAYVNVHNICVRIKVFVPYIF